MVFSLYLPGPPQKKNNVCVTSLEVGKPPFGKTSFLMMNPYYKNAKTHKRTYKKI